MVLPDLRNWALLALSVLVVALGLSTWQYKRMYAATDFALAVQNNAIKAQNKVAEQLLAKRTIERDALQKKLEERAAAQGKTDEKAVAQIGADDKQQRAAPVRVRVHDCTRDAGSGGGRAPGEAAAAAGAGAEDTGAASGVLSKEGARRLADALTEVETMSAAYASCRAELIAQ
ncbi:hypothetical protein [Variovorax sp. AFSI2.2]|uniref:hypothetical protein n=1 Tax=Variovorax sp. AFSI2.2 TaxID=3384160 RepID=UPI003EBCF8C1